MGAESKRVVAALAITITLLTLAAANLPEAHNVDSGVQIDVFTQQEPYSGRGVNVSSDAFAPGDLVILYALVTHNEAPLVNMMISYYVQSPNGSSFYSEGLTDAFGVAAVSFAIPYKSVNITEIFGEWTVQANVSVDGVVYQDFLTFRVDWVVKVLTVKTLDGNLTYRNMFGIGGDVGVEVTLRSIAMVAKNATLTLVVQDESLVPVASLAVNDFIVPPNERTVTVYFRLFLPKWSRIGNATVFASALTAPTEQDGVPYSPEVSTQFYIMIQDPLIVTFHDASILEVIPSATSVRMGESVEITVVVRNEGTEFEDFQVSTLRNSTVLGTADILALAPYSAAASTVVFNTSDVQLGNYTVSAFIPPVVDEADLSDNVLVDGVIQVRAAREYFLTVKTDPLNLAVIPGQGWYDDGSNATLNAPDYVLNATDVRYRFDHWDVDGTPGPGNPITVTMNANHTATAHYTLQYYLTVDTEPLNIVVIPGQGWYDEGVNTILDAPETLSNATNVRYEFSHWGIDGISQVGKAITVTMNASHTATAHYVLQYYLTVSSPYGTTGGEGWYNANSTAYASLDVGTIDNEDGTRRLFVNWTGDASGTLFMQSEGIYMNTPKTAVADWKTQYYLTIATVPSGITTVEGEGWYDELENVTLTAPSVPGYDFARWDVDGVSRGSAISSVVVLMDAPHDATANYSVVLGAWYPPYWFYWAFPFILVPLLFLIILLYRRRRNKESETLYAGWTASYYV